MFNKLNVNNSGYYHVQFVAASAAPVTPQAVGLMPVATWLPAHFNGAFDSHLNEGNSKSSTRPNVGTQLTPYTISIRLP